MSSWDRLQFILFLASHRRTPCLLFRGSSQTSCLPFPCAQSLKRAIHRVRNSAGPASGEQRRRKSPNPTPCPVYSTLLFTHRDHSFFFAAVSTWRSEAVPAPASDSHIIIRLILDAPLHGTSAPNTRRFVQSLKSSVPSPVPYGVHAYPFLRDANTCLSLSPFLFLIGRVGLDQSLLCISTLLHFWIFW